MRVDQRLVDITNEAARQVGIPLTIVDGFRETAGRGASNSQHLYGRAFDISGQGLNNQDRLDLSEAASTLGITGIGFYSGGSLHWDIRPGARTVWGDDWTRATVPEWAKAFASQHEAGAFFDSGALDSSLGGDELGSAVGDVTDASPELGALSSQYESRGDPTIVGEDRTAAQAMVNTRLLLVQVLSAIIWTFCKPKILRYTTNFRRLVASQPPAHEHHNSAGRMGKNNE
jgi:hypothetical protein